jgi:nucleotide-binding universal stress UspA family protein
LIRGADLELVGMPDGGRGFEDDEKAAWDASVQAAEQRMADGGRKMTMREATGDDIAHSLVELADSIKADLIVIGLRRRSPVGKLLLGSNAQRVLLEASCPVLAVKAPGHD